MGAEPHADRKRRNLSRDLMVAGWVALAGVLAVLLVWSNFDDAQTVADREEVRLALPARPVPAEAPPPAPAPAPVQKTEAPAPVQSVEAPAPPPPAADRAPEAADPPAAAPPLAAAAPAKAAPRGDATPTWVQHSRPFDANDRRPRVAVVVGDLGLSSAATTAAIQRLPGEMTLAFSPYADGLDRLVAQARAAGHEVLLNLPMEPVDFPASDPGPRTLLTSLTAQQNLERLDWVLGRVSGYVGVTNQMGSRFTAAPDALKPVLAALNERGLVFLDSRATPRSVVTKLAADIGLPRAAVDRQIDNEAARAAIDARLEEVERIARDKGSAVAMAQPYPVTIERLAAWGPSLEAKGLVLAPLTAVVNRQADR